MLKKILSRTRSVYNQALFPYTPAGIKRKVIFVHIPKSAGTAVRAALGEPDAGRQHLPWWVYQQASPKRFHKFYKFAFVRNPFDRAFSGYCYLKAGGNHMGDLSVAGYLAKYNNFDDFAEGELFNGRMIYHPIFRPQCWYLCDWKGEVQVDYVGRFETIDADFQYVARELSLDNVSDLPIVNKSSERLEEISSNAKSIVSAIYKDDFNVFGY